MSDITDDLRDQPDLSTEAFVAEQGIREETMVINMGPQHPSTHGVLRLVLELDGEEVVSCRPVIGYLHTGIEKNAEYRTWQQGVAYVTRMDYVGNFFNELAYCLAVERLLGIEAPPRAQVIRVMFTELQRIASHLVWIATSGLELGAVSMMLYGLRERELVLDIFESASGLRMNYSYFRIGGLAADLQEGAVDKIRGHTALIRDRIEEYDRLLTKNPVWLERLSGVGYVEPKRLLELGATGPVLRAAGFERDVRKDEPYSGIDAYDFDVPTQTSSDCYGRYLIRLEEMRQSLRVVEQCVDALPGGPVMVEDPKVAWPAHLEVGPDGIGNSEAYVKHIMEESMEALIHHFKLVTQGISVPEGEVIQPVESSRGELACYVCSDGGNRPYRVRMRDPAFVGLQSLPDMVRGQLIADVVACIASLDPVMGGVDR